MDKKLLKKLLIIGGGFLGVLILFIMIVSITRSISNKKNPYGKIKSNAVVGAQKYYDSLKEKLNSGESIEISFDELIAKKYMDEYASKVDDGVKCSGMVTISNKFDTIVYTSNMDCGKYYKDETLYDHIISNNEIVSSGDGIYDLYNRYIYRGENVNNYVEFDNKTWYIVDIEKNGNIRLFNSKKSLESDSVWDDRYNVIEDTEVGYNDFEKSRIYDSLKELEKTTITENGKKYIIPQDICYGARSKNSTDNSNSIECSKTLSNHILSTLTVSDVITASIDSTCNSIRQSQCSNYNYLASRKISSMWTFIADSDNSYRVYTSYKGKVLYKDTNDYYNLYVTVKLSPEVLYLSGDGTESNPYKIKEN